MTPSNLSIRGASVRYGSVTVLANLDLEVAQSEFLVLLGPSGCGKSTLLNAIAGLLDLSEGQVWIGDRNVTWEEPKDRGIGMVFQSYALYPRMSVRQNLAFGLQVARAPKAEIERRVMAAAQMLRLDALLDRKPAQLSGGQRQRVAIGRAVVREAPVMLFDEPLSNLDAQLRAELRVEIKRLHQRLGATMIYVTHDQIEALTLADRIAVMQGGVIQQLASPRDLYDRPANRFVAGFVGAPAMNFADGRVEAGRFLGDGFAVDLAEYDTASLPNGAATLGIRPEDITQHPNGLQAVVEMVEPMGADSLVWCRLGPTALSMRVSGHARATSGDRLGLRLAASRASLFAADTGLRL